MENALKKSISPIALAFAVLAGFAGQTVAASGESAASAPRFPVHLVSSSAKSSGSLTLRYFTPRPREQFCLAYAGVDVGLGPGWQHGPRCVTSDQYGSYTATLPIEGRGTVIVSIVLPDGTTHSDTLQMGALLDKERPRGRYED